jgi:hypothetical protein
VLDICHGPSLQQGSDLLHSPVVSVSEVEPARSLRSNPG